MKLKNLFRCALIATLVAFGSTETIAQKRATGKKTTSSRTTSTTKKPAGAPLDASNLVDTRYFVTTYMKPNDAWLFQWVSLKSDNYAIWDYTEDKVDLKWRVSGNNLKITNGPRETFSETSNNGGKTFTGLMNGSELCNFYDISKSHGSEFTAEGVEKDLLAGNYYTFLGFQVKPKSMIMGFPVTVKFLEDEETPGSGIFKISGEHKLMAGLGNMKFDYEFEEDRLITSKNNGEKDVTTYNDWTNQYFYLSLGPSKAGSLYLYFIKK